MSTMRSLMEAKLDGVKVLVRAGFDVPMENGVITDASRIEAVIPTVRYILDHGGAVLLAAHQDRPKGKVVAEMSQKPLVPVLEKLLGQPVAFAESCTGADTKARVDALAPGQVLLLENLRFDSREEANDPVFAQELASYAGVYVNEAFTNSHREHASMAAVPRLIPGFMGLQLEQEVTHLSKAIHHPARPLTLIISGAKVETKLPVIEFFLSRGDDILTGGVIANTIAAASGAKLGKSLVQEDLFGQAEELLEWSQREGAARIHALSDARVCNADNKDSPAHAAALDAIGDDEAVYDVGPRTAEEYLKVIRASQTIVWNGPLGTYRSESFAVSSMAIAAAIAEATVRGAVTVIGGGDTIDFHTRYGLPLDAYTFVSTGGGAMLDFVSGKTLPALAALAA